MFSRITHLMMYSKDKKFVGFLLRFWIDKISADSLETLKSSSSSRLVMRESIEGNGEEENRRYRILIFFRKHIILSILASF